MENRKGLVSKLLDIFIIANFAFLALDVFIAHSINAFDHLVEWLPVYFSLCASVLLSLTIFTRKKRWKHWYRYGIGCTSICIGVAGMLFHLSSNFFSDLTLKSLVYAAPFVAPLSFAGLGLLLIMNGMVSDLDLEWAQWIVVIAGCGWFGNFMLSVLDHAQNGFFNPTEWLPVFTSSVAVGCLVTLLLVPPKRFFLKFCIIVLGINFIIGIAGFFFHLSADLQVPAVKRAEGFLYGAPLLAPLLFPNLSLLALLGIWKLFSRTEKDITSS